MVIKRDIKRRPFSSVALLAGFLSAVSQPGCGGAPTAPTTATAPVAKVHVVRATEGKIARSITLPGYLRAEREVVLVAKVSGYLASIAVDRGDRVKAGDVLAVLEIPEMLADVLKFRAEAQAAELDLRRVTNAGRSAPDLVMPQVVDGARAKSEVAKASLQRIETLLEYAKIVAPFDGIVTRRWVDAGAFLPAAGSGGSATGASVVTLMDLDRVRVEMAVAEPEVPWIREGLPVKVTVAEIAGSEFDGVISRFAYSLDTSTRQMAAEVDLPNLGHVLRPGMVARCRIELESKPGALLLPAETLIAGKSGSFVFVVRDGKAVRLPVKTGFDDGISVEILTGLTAQDRVVGAGRQAITDGQAVEATEVER